MTRTRILFLTLILVPGLVSGCKRTPANSASTATQAAALTAAQNAIYEMQGKLRSLKPSTAPLNVECRIPGMQRGLTVLQSAPDGRIAKPELLYALVFLGDRGPILSLSWLDSDFSVNGLHFEDDSGHNGDLFAKWNKDTEPMWVDTSAHEPVYVLLLR